MELLNVLLTQAVSKDTVAVNINFEENIAEICNSICYKTLEKIHKILDNTELSDFECIERIVSELENINFDGGSRHDF